MVKEFQNRIVQAGQIDLLLINYEMLIYTINEAMEVVDSDDEVVFKKLMTRAQKLTRELSDNLDFRYDISRDLMALYVYVNKQLINASVTKKKEPLENALSILNTLLKGWEEVSKSTEVNNKPMVGNAQKVYAGLTYGKGALNETVYQPNQSRGLMA